MDDVKASAERTASARQEEPVYPVQVGRRAASGRAADRGRAPIRDSGARTARKSCCRACWKRNRHEHFDREIMNEIGELGFLGATSKATAAPG